jgi:hypothetical protein
MRADPRTSGPKRFSPEPGVRFADVIDASIVLVRNAREGALRLVEGITDDARDVVREARALRQVARHEATRIRDAGRAIPRGARVASELLRLVAAYRLDAAVRPARDVFRGVRAGELARERLHRLSAERLDPRRPPAPRLRQGLVAAPGPGAPAPRRGDARPHQR